MRQVGCVLGRVLPASAAVAWWPLCLVACLLPVAEGWVYADVPCGLLWVWVLKLCAYALRPGSEGAAEIVSGLPVFGMIFIGVGLAASGFNCTQIVHAQAGGLTHWLIGPLWPAAYAWIVYTAMEPGASKPGDAGVHAASLAQYAHMLINASMFSLIFLGGWLSPVDQWWGCAWINRWVPGLFWWLIKTVAGLWVYVWFRDRLPCYGPEDRIRIAWRLCLPLAACAFLCLAGVKALGYVAGAVDTCSYASLVYLGLGCVDCLRSGRSVIPYMSLIPLRTVRWIVQNITLDSLAETGSLAPKIVFTPEDKVLYRSARTENVTQGSLFGRDE